MKYYGSLGKEGLFTEETSYDPKSPYSASKASSDHMVRAYNHTFGIPAIISNCSNNYGPNQFPEKLIPLAINNIKNNKPIPVYGKGENIRDWLYVEDHASAIDLIFHRGKLVKLITSVVIMNGKILILSCFSAGSWTESLIGQKEHPKSLLHM